MGQGGNECGKDEIHTFEYTGQSSNPNMVLSVLVSDTKNHMNYTFHNIKTNWISRRSTNVGAETEKTFISEWSFKRNNTINIYAQHNFYNEYSDKFQTHIHYYFPMA